MNALFFIQLTSNIILNFIFNNFLIYNINIKRNIFVYIIIFKCIR